MIQHLLGATLMAGVVVYLVSETGRLRTIRQLRHGATLRRTGLALGLFLGLANLAALAAPVPLLVGDLVAAATLAAAVLVALVARRAVLTVPAAPQNAPRVLVVGAHPDDLELAAGGTLAKLADAGHEIHALVMSRGQVGGDSSRRPSEARAGAALLGLAHVEVLDLPDTDLANSSQEMVAAIEARLKRLSPELLFTHSAHDLHQDHQAVHLAAMRAGRRQTSILCFESPSTTRDFNPAVFVDVSDYLDIKVEVIRCHRDQSGKPYMGAGTIRGMASFRGSQSRTGFAEGFEVMRLLADAPGILAAAHARRARDQHLLNGDYALDQLEHLPVPTPLQLTAAATERTPS